MERGQFTFYRSFWEAIQELPTKDKAAVICAVCAYALDGVETSLTGTSKAIFLLIKPTLDASAKKAEIGKRGGSKPKATDKQNESETEANDKQTAREKEKEKEKEDEIEGERENECSPPIPPSRSAKKQHGVYGWVKLSREEYARLMTELGPEELARCIQYVDESAQKSGNKNRWKDWNLVIRSCHREGWGLRHGRQGGTPDYAKPVDAEKAQAELSRMERLLEKMGGGGSGEAGTT